MDYYLVLGIDRSSTAEAVHKAFRELSRSRHPDRFPEKERGKAEKEYQEIVKAYNTLKDPVQRQKYDTTLSQPAPTPAVNTEQQFQQFFKAGVVRFQQKQYEAAAEYFTKAVFYKETAESCYYKGMSEFQVLPRRKNALQSLQKAHELDQFNPRYAKALARALRDLGMQLRAKSVILKALELQPEDEELCAWLLEVDPDAAGEKKGFLGNFFSKFRGN
jgi:curved DNA-binding protein CbpA